MEYLSKTAPHLIVTDDLKLTVDSTSSLLQTLQELGCADHVSKLREKVLDISLKEVLILLQCVFSSNTPLTDTFLKNKSLRKISIRLSPCLEKNGDYEAELDKVITFDAIVRKQDMKIMYVECGEDFVNLLFTFLAIPLESTWAEISGISNLTLGCVGNLCKSFKDLSGSNQVSASKCLLPYFYGFGNQLLDIIATKPPPRVYLRYSHYFESFSLTTKRTSTTDRMTVVDPKSDNSVKWNDGIGFVKRDTKFTVSDDLIVTPMKSSSSFSVLKKLQIRAEDLEVQVISISKAEALNLLRALLVTSSALSSAFRNLVVLKVPKEEDRSNPNSKKPKTET